MSNLIPGWRDRVVEEALTWVGTKYHHMADKKGAGVDCAMILVRVYGDLGLIPAVDPRPYPAQWYLHRDEELYMGWFEKYMHRVTKALPGDVALYRFGRCAAHGAIVVDDNYMIHAYEPSGVVEMRERWAPLSHGELDSYWTVSEQL